MNLKIGNKNLSSTVVQDMTQPIGHVALSVVDTSTALRDIDSIDIEHFRQLGSEECTKFVHWVRETMAIGMIYIPLLLFPPTNTCLSCLCVTEWLLCSQ